MSLLSGLLGAVASLLASIKASVSVG